MRASAAIDARGNVSVRTEGRFSRQPGGTGRGHGSHRRIANGSSTSSQTATTSGSAARDGHRIKLRPRPLRVDARITTKADGAHAGNSAQGARLGRARQCKTGDTLLILEAMKMELPIRAPADGVVRVGALQEGELVQPDIVLVELE